MSSQSLPYYPGVTPHLRSTPFGCQIVEEEYLYHRRLKNGKTVVQVDTLRCLDNYIDESCFLVRDYLFDVLSGTGDVSTTLSFMYRRYPKLRAYINDRFYYGDCTVPLITRVVFPLRERIDEYVEEVFPVLRRNRGKFLIRSRDYLYFAYDIVPEIEVKGMSIIC